MTTITSTDTTERAVDAMSAEELLSELEGLAPPEEGPGMSEVLGKIRDRYYAVDFDKGTFYRAQPDSSIPDHPHMYQQIAADLLSCKYWRSDLTYMQNVAANAIADGSVGESDNINVTMTALRITKEREFLRAVAGGDEEVIAEIERDEAGAAIFARETGGVQIGSAVVHGVKEAA
jgi:hypothetical protein